MQFITFTLLISFVAAELKDQLQYFETLKHVEVKARKKRSVDGEKNFVKDLSFSAFGRDFNLVLTPGSPVIASDFAAKVVYRDGRTSPLYVNPNDFYTGHLSEDESVQVDAHQEGNVWGVNVYDKDEIYTLEPSWRHLPPSDNHTMIVYRHSDIKWDNIFPELNEKNKSIKVCGAIHPEDDPEFKPSIEKPSEQQHVANDGFDSEHSRKKRSPWALNTCHIIAVADYTFFTGPGGGFPHQTANYLVQTMQKVDKIFRKTVWNEEQQLTGLGFQIKEMRIHTEYTDTKDNEKHYNMNRSFWPNSDLLKQFGQEKELGNFCLAHLFTHRKFDGGVLGLAYIASSRKYSSGGICSQQGSSKTVYNTGFSSTMNTKGYNMLTQEAVLVTAHEFGHNWGSEHDAETNECAPSSFNKGRYLMFPYAVSGYDENNDEFSPCSKRYVTQVLLAHSGRCFKEFELEGSRYRANVPMCGNGVIDKGEECDSGGVGISGNDSCCDNTCMLRANATCSQVNFECCKNCQTAPRGTVCRGASKEMCQEKAVCSGFSLECPASVPVPDAPETICIDEGVCKGGKCLGYCERHIPNSKPCRCTTPEEECLRCCEGTNKTCQSVNVTHILTDGRPCAYGYCEKGKCTKGRANMIQRLFSFIEKLTPDSLVAFMKSNVVGTIIVFSLIIWIPASWTVSCLDKKYEKKSRKLQQHWSSVLASQLDNYKVKDAALLKAYQKPSMLSMPNIMEGGKRKLPPLMMPVDRPVERKYKFHDQPDGPEELDEMKV